MGTAVERGIGATDASGEVPPRGFTYDEWAHVLREHFFNTDRADKPVTLFVDDDLLGSLQGMQSEDGARSLAEAVRGRLNPDSYGRRFARIEQESIRWKVSGGEGDPPALPLLALAVLAGTRMGAADGIASHNYWRRFRDLLGFREADLKGYDETFPLLWEHLRWWLEERHKGRLGLTTARTHAKWRIIGYALSQALFREADRRHITEFFLKIGLDPGEQVPRSELLAYFRAWAPQSPLTSNAKQMAADPDYEDWLIDILEEEAAHWDGVVRDESGRRVGRLAIALETFPAPTYFVVAQRPDSFPRHAAFQSVDGTRLDVANDAGAWYAETLPLDPAWLEHGLRLESDGFVLAYRALGVIALGEDSDMGCWVSVTRIQPGEDYRVLASRDQVDDVRAFLRAWDLDGIWHELTAAGTVPDGWALFTDVAIGPVPPSAEVPPALRSLVPSPRERLTFRGGLPLKRSLNVYLHGGEPDVWLPTLLEEEELVLAVGGEQIAAAPGQRVELRALELPPGTYEVSAGLGEPLVFTTVETLGAFEGEGTAILGFPIDMEGGLPVAAAAGATAIGGSSVGRVWITGATIAGDPEAVPAARETVILPLRARAYAILGAEPGQVFRPTEPAGRPDWMSRVGGAGLFPFGFEVYPPFEPVWLVVTREGGPQVRLRHPLSPRKAPADGARAEALTEWCDEIASLQGYVHDQDKALLDEYVRVAEEVRPA